MTATLIVALSVIGALSYFLFLAHRTINNFPVVLSDRLSVQQISWMEALKRKDAELREITDAYLLYQQKVIPVNPDRKLEPSTPRAFRYKPNPPLTDEEKKRLGK